MPMSSASVIYASSTTHATPDAPTHRPQPLLPPQITEIDLAALLSSDLPRARFDGRRNRHELLHRLPLFFALFAPSNRLLHRSRDAPPQELVAGVAPVTIWSRQCANHIRRTA